MRAQEVLDQFHRDVEYFNQHRAELARQYSGHWVAIYQQRVAGAASDRQRLTQELQSKRIPPGLAYREHISDLPSATEVDVYVPTRTRAPEQLLRKWLDELVPDEQARLAAFLQAARSAPLPAPATPAIEAHGDERSAGPGPVAPVSEIARAILTEYASLREEMWRKVEGVSGLSNTVLPLARRIEGAIDDMVALSLEYYLRAFEDRLREEAGRDHLTGLLDRGKLTRRLHEELERAQRYQRPFAVLFIDLDDLKEINDRQGHAAGDQALRELAHALRQASRSVDALGRYGGDEFVCVLPETSGAGAAATAWRMLQSAATATIRPDRALSISVGVATFPDSGTAIPELLQAADAALYQVKARGGNGYAIPDGSGDFSVTYGHAEKNRPSKGPGPAST
jgi:diguanylate cyclase (GGDEF)-like protein